MKTVIYLIVIIGWSILQARRKALREQKRKEALAAQMPIATTSAVPLGAVSAQDNSPLSTSDLISTPEPGDQFFQDADREVPEQIKPVIEYARKAKKKKREERQPIEKIAEVSSIGMQNYEKVDALRKHFVLDRVAIRNYVITREVLGPPRSRKPFHPAMKDRE